MATQCSAKTACVVADGTAPMENAQSEGYQSACLNDSIRAPLVGIRTNCTHAMLICEGEIDSPYWVRKGEAAEMASDAAICAV